MSVARITEISAESSEGFEAAIKEGIDRANQTLRNVRRAWVENQIVEIENGKPTIYRVHMKVTFVLDA